jgi:hypothetical protein
VIEIALDVDIEHPVEPPAALARLPESIDRRSAGAISVGVVVEDRLQISFDHLLSDPVADRGNAQWPGPSIALGKFHPSDRRRKVAP